MPGRLRMSEMQHICKSPTCNGKAMHCGITCRSGMSCDCYGCCSPRVAHRNLGIRGTAQHMHICMFRFKHVHISSLGQVWKMMLHVLAGDGAAMGHVCF